jgi:hypothetical protein
MGTVSGVNPDVTCVLQGQLGNNLFQVAAMVAYAHKHGLSCAIPAGYEVPYIYRFGLPVTSEVSGRVLIEETQRAYAPIPYTWVGPRIAIKGYYQSYRFFEQYASLIRSIFPLDIAPRDSVSIHVRRGDYSHLPQNRTLSLYYYTLAVDMFLKKGLHSFEIFSDDLGWCQEWIPLCSSGAEFTFVDEKDPVLALGGMASCCGHILGNSTFSWWGAWLDPKYSDHLVIAPEHTSYYSAGYTTHADTCDLFPPEWVQLPDRGGIK